MWRILIALMFGGLALPAQDTASLSRRVAARYRSLDAFHMEGSYEIESRQGNGAGPSGGSTAKFVIDSAERGLKRRVDFKGSDFALSLITNGSTIWTYLPKDKSYTKVEAAASNDSDEDGGNPVGENMVESLYGSLTRHYADFDRFTAQTQMEGEAELKLSGGKTRCWILVTRFSNAVEKNWVDQQTFLIRKAEEDLVNRSNGTTRITVTEKQFELGKPDESAFTFEPRSKDKQVDELNIPGMTPVFVGKRAAEFTLKDAYGERVNLADYRGKVVVLDFWATWCPPCRRELPTINKLASELRDKDVIVLGIDDEGSGIVKSFCQKNSYTFTTLQDSGRKLHRAYQANAIPNLFVIGRDGVIVKHFVGARDEPELRAAIQTAASSK